jgi:hypothetical protein
MLCRSSLSREHIATENPSQWHFLKMHNQFFADTSVEENIKLSEHVDEHSILYDWKDPGHSRKYKIKIFFRVIL